MVHALKTVKNCIKYNTFSCFKGEKLTRVHSATTKGGLIYANWKSRKRKKIFFFQSQNVKATNEIYAFVYTHSNLQKYICEVSSQESSQELSVRGCKAFCDFTDEAKQL